MNSSLLRIAQFACILTATSLLSLQADIKLKYRSGETIYEIAGHDSGKPFALLNGQKKYMPPRGHWIVDATFQEIIENGFIMPVYMVKKMPEKDTGSKGNVYEGTINAGILEFAHTAFKSNQFFKTIWSLENDIYYHIAVVWVSGSEKSNADIAYHHTNTRSIIYKDEKNLRSFNLTVNASEAIQESYPVVLVFNKDSGIIKPKPNFLFDIVRKTAKSNGNAFDYIGADEKLPTNKILDYQLVHWLSAIGNLETFKDSRFPKKLLSIEGLNEHTPVSIATITGKAELVSHLLGLGVNPNKKILSGQAPINLAAVTGDYDIAKSLIEAGARTSPHNRLQSPPIFDALNHQQGKVVKLLAENGARFRPDRESTEAFLMNMASQDEIEIVEYLIQKKIRLHPRNHDSHALIAASVSASPEMIQLLIDNGSKIDEPSKSGWTALMVAAMSNPKAAKTLVENGANIHHKNDKGISAIHIAIGNRQVETTDLLLSAGADPNLINPDGTPLFWLATASDNRIGLNQLIEAGAICEVSPETAIPIMEYAFRYDIPEIVEITLNQCLDPDFYFYEDFSAYWVANYYGSSEVAKMLKSKGIEENLSQAPNNFVNSQLVSHKIKPLKAFLPPYKAELQKQFGEFTAVVSVIIDENGMVRFPKVTEAPDNRNIRKTIQETINKWVFHPITHENGPVRTRVNIPLTFIPEAELEDIFDLNSVETKPELIEAARLDFPREYLTNKIDAQVLVEFVIDEEGRVSNIEIINFSHIGLVKPAVESLRQWKYKPGVNNGKPVKVRARLPMGVNFK